MKTWFVRLAPALLVLSACGGKVVVEGSGAEVGAASGAGGAGGAGVGGAVVATVGVSTSTGGGIDCPPGTVEMNGQCVPSSTAPCLIGGNVLYLNGEPKDFIHPGEETLQQGEWSAWGSSAHVSLNFMGTNDEFWFVDFSSEQLPGQPALTEQLYPNATRWPFEAPGEPGLSISGDGKGCNMLTGQFQIEEITLAGDSVVSITASFEQECDGDGGLLRGCVHYEQ